MDRRRHPAAPMVSQEKNPRPGRDESGCSRWPRIVLGLSPVREMSIVISLLAATFSHGAEESWIKVTAEHFTILTPAGESDARKWAVELEQFRRGLQELVPVPPERLRPVTVVLFRNDRAMQPFLPLEKGEPAKLGGLFVRANDINTIMLSLARKAAETRHVVFHEAVHWHLSAREGFMPLWLEEGLAELYATFELRDARTFTFGTPRNDYLAQLRAGNLLPLAQLLGLGRDSLLYNEGTRASVFYTQSWAFVHFLFYGEGSPGANAVFRYLDLLPTARSPDDAFVAAFGASYPVIERQLVRYIAKGSYRRHERPRSTDDISRQLKVSAASSADLELAKGSLLLGTRTPAEAEPHLRRAAELAPGDPRPWELLGHIAIGRKDYAAAAGVLTKAVAAGSASYLVHHNLAVARLPATTLTDVSAASVDPETMDLAAANFRNAIRLAPSHVASYEGLAGLMHGMATFVPADVDLLIRGLLQAPGNVMIEAGVAAGEVRLGRVSDGRARLERLCKRGHDPHDPGLRFARQVLATETLRAELQAINELATENRLEEIIAIADAALARGLDPGQRQVMLDVRRRSLDYQTINAAVALANKGSTAEATAQLKQLLATEPELSVRSEAERLLREIAKQRRRAER